MSSEINDIIGRMTGQKALILPGEVLAVDADAGTCDVRPDNGDADLLDVALLNGVYPAEGAQVLVGLIENRRTDTFLVAADKITHYQLATENESLHTLLKDIVAEVRGLKFSTNAGPTIALLTDPNWLALNDRIDNLLLP
ncbi:hypothetical protein GCM10023185_06790 [Hymenobacter saemangeumensis]|uniref:DUF3846 domain-containing protein n=1 Tax=Hymenobacter saemangeumensis TaxID=1084522 RepID=A0ABP8I2E6_9BACT